MPGDLFFIIGYHGKRSWIGNITSYTIFNPEEITIFSTPERVTLKFLEKKKKNSTDDKRKKNKNNKKQKTRG